MIIDIIGAGIGGLTLGVSLKKKGFKVRVFEQASEIKPVGAGIVLANNAMQVYRSLGLSDKIIQKGNSISSVEILDSNFKTISETNLLDFEKEYQLKNTAIHRGDLQQILIEEFVEGEIFLNHTLNKITEKGERKVLEFKNNKSYDSSVVIGADGIFSKVRELLFDPVEIRNANQVCWRGVLDYTLPKAELNIAKEAWGKGSRFGYVQIKPNKVYWYAVLDADSSSVLPNRLPKELFLAYDKLVSELISSTPIDQIHTSFLQDIKPFSGWSKSNVCLIGDAAHATTPNMGQGACQAIEDAYVLSFYLKKLNVKDAFLLYEKNRIKKAHQVVKASFMIGRISQLSNPILIFLRNAILRCTPARVNKNQMSSIFKITDVS